MESLDQFRGLLGLGVFVLIAYLLSTDRRAINWRLVVVGLTLQIAFAFATLRTTAGQWFFAKVSDFFLVVIDAAAAGSTFVFGVLAQPGTAPVVDLSGGGQGVPTQLGTSLAFGAGTAYFAFGVLSVIIFFSSLMAVLYHLGVMQILVKGMAWIMFRLMRVSGAESLSASANVFVGQTEAPLVVRPFLPHMTRSELMAIMTGGLATIAGSVMVAYIGLLSGVIPDIAGHLLAASIMSAPASLVIAKIMVPETETPETMGELKVSVERPDVNVIGAAARGASEGLQLALNVAAMLIAFLALLALVNAGLGWVGGWFGMGEGSDPLSLNLIFSYVFWPLAWVMGVPANECMVMGDLIGLKTFANEFVAYLGLLGASDELGPRGFLIGTYALCGFANIGSIGILIGGISPLAPERRDDLVRLGLRALIAGTLACFMTASIAGVLLTESDLEVAARAEMMAEEPPVEDLPAEVPSAEEPVPVSPEADSAPRN